MSKLAVTGLGWIVVPVAVLLGAVVVEYLARWWVRHGKAYYVFTPGLRLRLHPHPQVFPQVEPSVRFDGFQGKPRILAKQFPRPDAVIVQDGSEQMLGGVWHCEVAGGGGAFRVSRTSLRGCLRDARMSTGARHG